MFLLWFSILFLKICLQNYRKLTDKILHIKLMEIVFVQCSKVKKYCKFAVFLLPIRSGYSLKNSTAIHQNASPFKF
ncbi:hypothetical protein B6D60_00070 [candidate division KSB1 bacterium 4484_87]|nr:MAG: hypothetical protein B6D60_00070 [candidate division KSB1 bacterium 4484_87]